MPWIWCFGLWVNTKKKYNEFTQKEEDTTFMKTDYTNLCEKDVDTNELDCQMEVKLFVTMKEFQKKIGAKAEVKEISSGEYMAVMDGDSKFSSNDDISTLINVEGSNMLVMGGEGDYIVPIEGILRNLRKYWDVKNKGTIFGDGSSDENKWEENDDY